MAEYRALRQNYTLLQLCRTPDLATEVTLQPVRRIDVDAAILFSDLLLPLEPMGIPFDFVKGEGPAIERPIRSARRHRSRARRRSARGAGVHLRRHPPDQARARRADAAHRLCRRAVHARVLRDRGRPLEQLRADQEPDVRRSRRPGIASPTGSPPWSPTTSIAQIDAGVDAVQVFDSWVGALNADDYREFALPHTQKIFAGDRPAACRRFISASRPARSCT